jgi:hypothetical protein
MREQERERSYIKSIVPESTQKIIALAMENGGVAAKVVWFRGWRMYFIFWK